MTPWPASQLARQADRQAGRQADRQTDRQAAGRTGGRTLFFASVSFSMAEFALSMPASRLAALTPICFKASSFAASTSLAAWLAASSALVSIRRRASSTALWKLLMDKPIVAFTADSPRVVMETIVSAHCRTAPSVGAAEAGAESGGDLPEADDEAAHGDSTPDAAVDGASVKMPSSNDASR